MGCEFNFQNFFFFTDFVVKREMKTPTKKKNTNLKIEKNKKLIY